MYSMPFSFVSKQKLERTLTLNSISLIFSRFLLWEELGGPEKDLFVFWLVLKKTGFFFLFFFFFLFRDRLLSLSVLLLQRLCRLFKVLAGIKTGLRYFGRFGR